MLIRGLVLTLCLLGVGLAYAAEPKSVHRLRTRLSPAGVDDQTSLLAARELAQRAALYCPGVCQEDSSDCATHYVSNRCDGPINIRCCLSQAGVAELDPAAQAGGGPATTPFTNSPLNTEGDDNDDGADDGASHGGGAVTKDGTPVPPAEGEPAQPTDPTPPVTPPPASTTVCFKTGNSGANLRRTPCGENFSPSLPVPKHTLLATVGDSQVVATCTIFTGVVGADAIWHNVRFNDVDGWVTDRLVNEAHCSPVTCATAVPAYPLTCARVKSTALRLRPGTCREEVLLTITKNQVLIASQADPITDSTCPSMAASWLPVTANGEAGYVDAAGVDRFPCTSDGWLNAFNYTVERLDRSTGVRGDRTHDMGLQNKNPNKFLLHTIEGNWPRWGDYESGTTTLDSKGAWPHFIVARNRQGEIKIGQYYSTHLYGRALVTGNKWGVVQVEIGAKAGFPFTEHDPEMSDAVAKLYHALSAASGGEIPICQDSKIDFVRDMAAMETSEQRVTEDDFKTLAGLCGHQHVYRNDHWDPGKIHGFKLLVPPLVSNPTQVFPPPVTDPPVPDVPGVPDTPEDSDEAEPADPDEAEPADPAALDHEAAHLTEQEALQSD